MAFITPCFIRKNTSELRKKLEELGYKPFGSVKYEWDTGWGLSTDNRLGEFESFDNNGLENIIKCESPDYEDSIDCETNEELFIAIASLRDDSDVNQWFVMDVEIYMGINQGDWFIATDRNKGKHIGTQIDPMYCHKATVEEIIEHFNKK
jgi:hypothetical protein